MTSLEQIFRYKICNRLLFLSLGVYLVACGGKDPGAARKAKVVREDTSVQCQDGVDNDNDGDVDCIDDDCVIGGFCNGSRLVEGECGDSIDNDGDELIDCADSDCATALECLVSETAPADCRDNIDNDNDGNTDCADSDCSGFDFCQNEDSDLTCSDGIDNNGDGLTDCADPTCVASSDVSFCRSETSDDLCRDGLDNDSDGAVDCADSDCAGSAPCAGEHENSVATCADHRDNDGDGLLDCRDPDCQSAGVAGCAGQEVCDDGIDNEGDGLTDCGDPDCLGHSSCSTAVLENSAILCGNDLDDDNDGRIDCADQGCFTIPPCGAEGSACDDGIDNDGNGLKDCDDRVACGSAAACTTVPEICNDGMDNDNNGQIDCADIQCASFSACMSKEIGTVLCADGNDNDSDSLVDCADPDCASEQFCGLENTDALCADLFDNDGDSLVDCADSDCSTALPCVAAAETLCTDGVDNDGDNLIDCADPDCSASCGAENTDLFCADQFDNDGDSLLDCADPDCAATVPCASTATEICDNSADDDGDGLSDCLDPDCLLDLTVTYCDSPALSVFDLQNGNSSNFPHIRGDGVGDLVRLRNVVITWVDATDDGNFYVADPGDWLCSAGLSNCYHSIQVVTLATNTGYQRGDALDIAGFFGEFNGESVVIGLTSQTTGVPLLIPGLQAVALTDLTSPLPVLEAANDILETNTTTGQILDPADDTLTAERYEGSIISLKNILVADSTTDPDGTVSYGIYPLDGPLPANRIRIGGRLFNTFGMGIVPGTILSEVKGLLLYTRYAVATNFVTEYRIEPRDILDWVIEADSDNDLLTDSEEATLGTDPNHKDSDRDGYSDFMEVFFAGGSVAVPADSDSDGRIDALESYLLDLDGDQIPDELDAVNYDAIDDDRDGDGIANVLDNDSDGDGVCDPGVTPTSASECILINGAADNCPFAPEPLAGYLTYVLPQLNSDKTRNHVGVSAAGDIYDGSHSGDVCDLDLDGDSVPNFFDNCPTVYNPAQADADNDNFGTLCDFDDTAANIQVDNVRDTPKPCRLPTGMGGSTIDPLAEGGFLLCSLIIEEVMYNLSVSAPTIADTNGDGRGDIFADEFIEVRNVSGKDLAIGGLEIHDASATANPRHVVPLGTVLRDNQRLVIFGGGLPRLSNRDALVQLASSGGLGLNNGSDKIWLRFPAFGGGALIDLASLAYGLPGEIRSGRNQSVSRYPDGGDRWVVHPIRSYRGVGGQLTSLEASPGSSPDNER